MNQHQVNIKEGAPEGNRIIINLEDIHRQFQQADVVHVQINQLKFLINEETPILLSSVQPTLLQTKFLKISEKNKFYLIN